MFPKHSVQRTKPTNYSVTDTQKLCWRQQFTGGGKNTMKSNSRNCFQVGNAGGK
jgi:hypothetical protein